MKRLIIIFLSLILLAACCPADAYDSRAKNTTKRVENETPFTKVYSPGITFHVNVTVYSYKYKGKEYLMFVGSKNISVVRAE